MGVWFAAGDAVAQDLDLSERRRSLVNVSNTLSRELGTDVPYVALAIRHPDEEASRGTSYALSWAGGFADVESLDACRRVEFQEIGGELALVETHHRAADGTCEASDGPLGLRVAPASPLDGEPARHRGRLLLQQVCQSSGMSCEIRVGPPSLDLSGVSTVREMLDRAVRAARADGVPLTFGVRSRPLREGSAPYHVVVFPPFVPPSREAMDLNRADYDAARNQPVDATPPRGPDAP